MSGPPGAGRGEPASWVAGIGAVTLVQEDLESAKAFYASVFELPVVYEDESSAVFRFGGTLVNLLRASVAPGVVAPAEVAPRAAGQRVLFTVDVEDVDAMVERLAARGVQFLSGPVDRPWGIRTACFQDPGGHLWELAH